MLKYTGFVADSGITVGFGKAFGLNRGDLTHGNEFPVANLPVVLVTASNANAGLARTSSYRGSASVRDAPKALPSFMLRGGRASSAVRSRAEPRNEESHCLRVGCQKQRFEMTFVEILRHIAADRFLAGLEHPQIAVAHLRRNLVSHMQQLSN